MIERLQKFMARCGVASRRGSEEIISQGRVSVNGKIIIEMGTMINPDSDEVKVDGKVINPEIQKIYILLNKPPGYITSVIDPQGRPTVMDLIDITEKRIYPVGRLDFDSEGLLILTNDGDLAYFLTHPKYEIKKQYRVVVSGNPGSHAIEDLRKGVDIGDYTTRSAEVYKVGKDGVNTIFKVVIHEGRNRQIRRMFHAIGFSVIHLKRESFGNISLGALNPGEWRYLTMEEVNTLRF